MKIAVHLLRDGQPRAVHEAFDPKELDLEFVDLKYLEAVAVQGTVEKFTDTVTFQGKMTSRVEHLCGRCLKAVEEKFDQPFELVYDVKGKEELETLEDLREILILEHPIRYLCREDCMGFCSRCGVNLNDAPCACPKEGKEANG
jgi:uncharacterized protein